MICIARAAMLYIDHSISETSKYGNGKDFGHEEKKIIISIFFREDIASLNMILLAFHSMTYPLSVHSLWV